MDNSSMDATSSDGAPKKMALEDLNREELLNKCKGLLVIAQKAKLSKTELQNEVESYKLQLEKCETEKKSFQDNIKTLQELVDSLTEQKLNYITEIDASHNKEKSLSFKCDSLLQDVDTHKADLIIKHNCITELNQKMSDLDNELVSLKRQNNRLVEENEQLLNQLSDLETKAAEFNNIGLQQMEQLKMLEEKVENDNVFKNKVNELNIYINELENKIQSNDANNKNEDIVANENKIGEITELYESEKCKKEKAYVKLKSYKEKILKCAACINQLKNSRFILAKTVKDYSENIPKWQNDIIKASKVLESQINELNSENKSLKENIAQLEKQLQETTNDKSNIDNFQSTLKSLETENNGLRDEVSECKVRLDSIENEKSNLITELTKLRNNYHNLNDIELPKHMNENKALKENINKLTQHNNELLNQNNELEIAVNDLSSKNKLINETVQKKENKDIIDNLNLQIKSLDTEKGIIVKEKLNARDNIVELENQNKLLVTQLNQVKTEVLTLRNQLDTLTQEKLVLEENYKKEKQNEASNFKLAVLQEQYDSLKKEHDNLLDLNGLLKEEAETLKLSLEEPRDDAEHLSDLNVSLQADIVKLETKLAAYKQENASLLIEVKESRVRAKEFDSLITDYEEVKSKLAGFKTENTELLNEMKEINQVLKERGESISKLQKAVSEMERLIETLERDRDNMIQERDVLVKKVDKLENELKNAEQKSNKNHEATEQIVAEKDNALKTLAERDSLITSLKDEIEKLKQQQTSSGAELPSEDMSTSTVSKAEEHSRMKDLDETFEEKYTKLRIFALKLKKKLNETVAQLQNTELDKSKLEKLLSEQSAANLSTSSVSVDETDSINNVENVTKIADLEQKLKTLTANKETNNKIAEELEKLKAELAVKSQELTAEMQAHKMTKNNLDKAQRNVKKKNVLSLEMEDYERSMKELTTKMDEMKKKMVQMESTIDTQEGTITAMKTQIKLLEEQVKSEETQNRLTKEELQSAIEESKEKDNVIQLKNEIISKLEQDMEDEKRKNEEADLEMTSVLSEKEKVIMSLGEDKAELNNKVKKLEFKCAELNDQLRIINIELADLKTEYTSYKVRAQSVLRQNQTVDHSQEEQLKEEAAALKAQIDDLTLKLTAAQEQLSDQSLEVESSRRRAMEASNEVARAQQRTGRLQADLARLSQQMDAERTQHKLQISTLTQCYKTQINELEAKMQKEAETHKKQLELVHETRSKLRSVEEINQNQYMLPVIPKDDSDGEMDINVSMIPREEGEGSESAPSPPLSKSFLSGGGGRRSPMPLERLLEEGVPEDEALDSASLGLTPEQEISELKRKLLAQQQRVKHVTMLLSESERECARMAQLSELLKSELRRVRGTTSNAHNTEVKHVTMLLSESERECARMAQLSELLKSELRRVRGTTSNAHNTEYMKNVTLKFLTLPPGDERGRLVPVLQKILTLSFEETQKIQAIAKGLDPNRSKGWGSYLPWPGGNK